MDQEQLEKKWLAGELSNEDKKEFKKLDDYNLNLEILESAKYFKASHFSSVKSYDHLKANLKEKSTPVRKLQSFKILYRIAALFVLGMTTYFFLFYNNLTTVKTLASQKTSFELPDASSVMLNASSTAEFNKKKWSEKREVILDGEAFFKVAKGAKFDVKTNDGIVSVLGTQFNVKNRDNYFEVKCFEGIVSVNSNDKSHRLTQGNTYRIINNVVVVDTTVKNQPEWLDNLSNFKSVPLYEVIAEFERQYNVVITVQNVDENRLFTGGFVHNNLEQALASITVPFNMTYKKVNSNKITIYKIE